MPSDLVAGMALGQRIRRRLLAVAAIFGICGASAGACLSQFAVIPPASATTTAPQACENAQLEAASSRPGANGSWTAVLLVHGITDSRDKWSQGRIGGGPSMAGSIALVPGTKVYTFDYSANSLDWVTSPIISSELASAIDCLASASGRQVIVVAHSMGGLAAQQAQGSLPSNELAQVITLGTPTKGSWLLALANRATVAGLAVNPAMTAL